MPTLKDTVTLYQESIHRHKGMFIITENSITHVGKGELIFYVVVYTICAVILGAMLHYLIVTR